jgi:hypothetical protein
MSHFKDLTYTINEILIGSECCIDLGDWPQAEYIEPIVEQVEPIVEHVEPEKIITPPLSPKVEVVKILTPPPSPK